MSSSLSPRSLRSSWVFSGSPSLLASGLPVAALEGRRLSEVSDAARCSVAGSVWARTSASMAPRRARLTSRSPGLSRSCRASSRSSSASRVRGSSASAPLVSSSSARSSRRSACRSAAASTWRCWAMTASCGFGMRRTGTSSSARHDEGDGRALRQPRLEQGRRGAAQRAQAHRRAGVGRSGRSRPRHLRIVGRALPDRQARRSPGTPRRVPARSRRGRRGGPRRRPRAPSRRGSGRARTTATSRTSAPTIGMATPPIGAHGSGTTRATVQSTSSATAIAGQGQPGAPHDASDPERRRCGPSAVRTAVRVGSSGPSTTARGSAGTTSGARRSDRSHDRSRRGQDPHQTASGLGSGRAGGGGASAGWARRTGWRSAGRRPTGSSQVSDGLAARSCPARRRTRVTSAIARDPARPRRPRLPSTGDARPYRDVGRRDRASHRRRLVDVRRTRPSRRDWARCWRGLPQDAATEGLGPAEDVGLGEERVDVGDDLGRSTLDRATALRRSSSFARTAQKMSTKSEPDGDGKHAEDRDRGGRLGPLHEARAAQPEGAEARARSRSGRCSRAPRPPGATPPKTKTIAVSGIEAAMSRKT